MTIVSAGWCGTAAEDRPAAGFLGAADFLAGAFVAAAGFLEGAFLAGGCFAGDVVVVDRPSSPD